MVARASFQTKLFLAGVSAAVLTLAARVGLSLKLPAYVLDVFPPETP